jgi:hypothetical protein
LIGKEHGEKKVYGVASGVMSSTQLTCDYGAFYGIFGPETHTFIDQAVRYVDPCGHGLTANGYCDGDTAIRCSDKWEGDRRMVQVDCALLDQVCAVSATGRVACGDGSAPVAHGAAPTVREIRTAIVKTAHRAALKAK